MSMSNLGNGHISPVAIFVISYNGIIDFLFPPRFVSPIPTALYHTSRNRVGISLISP